MGILVYLWIDEALGVGLLLVDTTPYAFPSPQTNGPPESPWKALIHVQKNDRFWLKVKFFHVTLQKSTYLAWSSLALRAVKHFHSTPLIISQGYISFQEFQRHMASFFCSSPARDDTWLWQRAIAMVCESNGLHFIVKFCLGLQLKERAEIKNGLLDIRIIAFWCLSKLNILNDKSLQ